MNNDLQYCLVMTLLSSHKGYVVQENNNTISKYRNSCNGRLALASYKNPTVLCFLAFRITHAVFVSM